MRISRSVEIDIDYDTTVEDLRQAFVEVPGNAKVRVRTNRGDRPWESDSHTIEIDWSQPS